MNRNVYFEASNAQHIRNCFPAQRISQSEIETLYRFESSRRTVADEEAFTDEYFAACDTLRALETERG